MTLFIISTLEGWPDIMYNFIDGSDENTVLFYYLVSLIFNNRGLKRKDH